MAQDQPIGQNNEVRLIFCSGHTHFYSRYYPFKILSLSIKKLVDGERLKTWATS